MEQRSFIVGSHVHKYASADMGRQALGTAGYGYTGTLSDLQEVKKQASPGRSWPMTLPLEEEQKALVPGLNAKSVLACRETASAAIPSPSMGAGWGDAVNRMHPRREP